MDNSKGQNISKAFFLKLNCPKNEQNIRQNSALESKKIKSYYVEQLLMTKLFNIISVKMGL